MLAPSRTPAMLVEKINRDLVEILKSADVQSTLVAQGAEAAPGSPAEFAEFIRAETASMKRLIEITGMRTN
jgi:tripartite-type tricarboxylate transporter receptor subunit TctC